MNMTPLSQAEKRKIVGREVSRGYPGINWLMSYCYWPAIRRTASALGISEAEANAKWQLVPVHRFWPTVREFADQQGCSSKDAFIHMLHMDADPAARPPHPFLG